MKQSLDPAKNYSAVAFNQDGTRVAVGTTSLTGGTVELWDLVARREGPPLPGRDSGNVTALLFGSSGLLLVGSNRGTVDIYSKYGDDLLLRLISVPALGGLLVDPKTGAFDGTAETMNMAAWRLKANDTEIYPLDLFFDDYYTPGLSQKVLSAGDHMRT